MIILLVSGVEMGDMNGMYCGIRCPESGLEDGLHVNKGKNCHLYRFLHVYAWLVLHIPLMVYFSCELSAQIGYKHVLCLLTETTTTRPDQNVSFIRGHAEKMQATSGKKGSKGEAKLFAAMAKL